MKFNATNNQAAARPVDQHRADRSNAARRRPTGLTNGANASPADAIAADQGGALPPQDVCDRARAARDARFDGLFFTAVTSTGIYCRPVCPAPAPKRRNVRYYASAAAAAAAGLRPCLRCRPELAPGAMAHRLGEALFDRALAMLADGALVEGSVPTLAARLGVSARQLQRMFVQQVGVTPLDAFPAGDLVLRPMLGNGMAVSERDAEQRPQRWRPWRAYAVLHFWHRSNDLHKERSAC